MRKPVDKIRRGESREAVWAAIRAKHGPFSVKEITQETRLKYETVLEYITGLLNAGYLAKIDTENPASFRTNYYRLVKDCGIEAPRVRKDGSAVTMGQGRDQMWRALWILSQKCQRFTVRDMVIDASISTCEVSESDAKHYLRYLCLAGYLAQKGGTYFMPASRWTGPKPPMIQRTLQVWDPNTRQVVWAEGDGHDRD